VVVEHEIVDLGNDFNPACHVLFKKIEKVEKDEID